MTLSPFEQSLWLLAGQGGSIGKPGESGALESPGSGTCGAFNECLPTTSDLIAEI